LSVILAGRIHLANDFGSAMVGKASSQQIEKRLLFVFREVVQRLYDLGIRRHVGAPKHGFHWRPRTES
jgi:hypothetical protein